MLSEFSPSPPQFYGKPPDKTYRGRQTISSVEDASTNSAIELPENCFAVEISRISNDTDWGYSFSVDFLGPLEDIETPYYEIELKQYEKRKADYEKRLAQWEIDKAKWDKKELERKELAEKVEYQRLKRKFES